jgi:hypothetical protein
VAAGHHLETAVRLGRVVDRQPDREADIRPEVVEVVILMPGDLPVARGLVHQDRVPDDQVRAEDLRDGLADRPTRADVTNDPAILVPGGPGIAVAGAWHGHRGVDGRAELGHPVGRTGRQRRDIAVPVECRELLVRQ